MFELPFYLYLGWQCLKRGLSIKTLAKANYALDHGEIGLSSKFDSQMAFNQDYFMPTELIEDSLNVDEKKARIRKFIDTHNFPVVLKSNLGSVGTVSYTHLTLPTIYSV